MTEENFVVHVPYLRRFARAFTGSQDIGDLYAKMALQSLASDLSPLDAHKPEKTLLFRAFVRAWSDTGGAEVSSSTVVEHCSADKIRMLGFRERQAFLLSALENFCNSEIADILEIPVENVADLLIDAENSIASELATSVLIIEDEPIIATDIQAMVEELGHRVCGIAATRASAVDLVKSEVPGIILSDVQLADGSSGIDAVRDILDKFNLPIIFVTAFPEQLLRGDESEPAYLISKPFQPESLKATISQALFFHDDSPGPQTRAG